MTSSGAHTFLARPARVDEIAAIAALFDLYLGALPDRARDLEAQLADSSLHALVVGAGGHLLGAGTYSVCDRAASRRKLHELDVLCRELRGAKAPFGWLESVAVAEGARNWGIGQELLQARLRGLQKARAHTVLSLVWRAAESERLLEAAGLSAVATVPAFWARSDAGDDYCPRCGSNCICEAVLFRGEFRPSQTEQAGRGCREGQMKGACPSARLMYSE